MMKQGTIQQSEESRLAWEFTEHTGKSIFLTGKAGTGKTTFLKYVREQSTKRMIVVAPTGVAAINAAGVTIHSFFQLPPSPFVPETHIKQRFDYSREKRDIMRTLDLLIIDEISMVRADLLDAIDMVLRRFRQHDKPFGGVQLLMIGDLQQLTPVVTPDDEAIIGQYYATPYFFSSHALQSVDYVTIALTHVYRQQDDTFVNLLNHIRDGRATAADLQRLNARCHPEFRPRPDDDYIRLTTHNRMADSYNEAEMSRLLGHAQTYRASIEDTFPEYLYPTADTLTLKIGAQVMFVKNDTSVDRRYYNGRIGHVTRLSRDVVWVLCPGDSDEIEVRPELWENTHYTLNEQTKTIEPQVQGTFSQLPLRLAWAITIHKSQGLTFERAIIDAQLSFAPGQVYVALSRCRTIEGLVLASPISESAIRKDYRVDEYIGQQARATAESVVRLPAIREEYYQAQLLELFDFWGLKHLEEALYRVLVESFQSYPKLIMLHKITLADFVAKLLPTAMKWTRLIATMPSAELHDDAFIERVGRSAVYFDAQLTKLFDTPLSATRGVTSNNKTAIKRLENALADIRQSYLARHYLLADISKVGFSTANYLRLRQEAVLASLDSGKKRTSRRKKLSCKVELEEQQPLPKPKEDTFQKTLKLYRDGKSIGEIAHERGYSTETIKSHLVHLLADNKVSAEGLLSKTLLATISAAKEKAGNDARLGEIRQCCPEGVSYGDITLALAIMKAKAQNGAE